MMLVVSNGMELLRLVKWKESDVMALFKPVRQEIGRASCRERV